METGQSGPPWEAPPSKDPLPLAVLASAITWKETVAVGTGGAGGVPGGVSHLRSVLRSQLHGIQERWHFRAPILQT